MITEFMQFIKTCVDKLALLGKPMNDKDLIKKILDELDCEYKSIVDAIEGRGTLISFDELHEKLINKEHCGAPWVVCPEDKLFATGQGLTQVDKFRLFDMDPLLYLG